MHKNVLFITSQTDLYELSSIFLNNGEHSVQCTLAKSLSESVAILGKDIDFDLIFVGHRVLKDMEIKNLSDALIPYINRNKAGIFGTNKAFKGQDFAKYYNELVPLSKILIDMYNFLQLKQKGTANYISFPLESLLHFKSYPFDCYLKVKKSQQDSYVHLFRENDEIDKDDVKKFCHKKVDNVYASVNKINKKMKILKNALRVQSDLDVINNPEKAFERTTQFALEVLNDSGLKISDEVLNKSREAYNVIQTVLTSPKGRQSFRELIAKESSFYFKHISMTSLVCCYILQEINFDSKANRLKLCAASQFQNLFLKSEQELRVCSQEDLDLFDLNARKRVERHALLAMNLLAENPLIDSDVLKIVKEQHGDKRGIGFPKIMSSSSKMSFIFQTVSLFSQQYLIELEREGSVDLMKIVRYVEDRVPDQDDFILKSMKNVAVNMVS